MASQETLRDVPADQVDQVVAGFKALGAAVQVFPQGGDLFTVVAIFQGAPQTTPFATEHAAEVLVAVPHTADGPLPTIAASTDFSSISQEYRTSFDTCIPDADEIARTEARVDHLQANAPRYRALGEVLQVPWYFIGIIHSLESNFNFSSHLHNGDPLVVRTTHAPVGRPEQGNPPFLWEQSATDALDGFVGQTDWSLARTLFRWESYNGFGYRKRGLPSPYLWSFSQHYIKGLFVEDHVFDPDKASRQCGAAVILKVLQARI